MSRDERDEDRRVQAEATLAALESLPAEPICVRIAMAVRLTGIPRSTLYELINAGELQTAKIGRSTFILYPSLKRLFERH